jgi:hypothetical protein
MEPDQARHQMSRYERRQFFETLCGLRDQYAGRSEDDRRSALLIDDAVLYAEAVMIAMDAGIPAAELVADAGVPTETMPAGDPRD